MAGRSSEDLKKAAEEQALSLLIFAWGYVFEAPTGTLHFMDIRCHCLTQHLQSSIRPVMPGALIKAWL